MSSTRCFMFIHPAPKFDHKSLSFVSFSLEICMLKDPISLSQAQFQTRHFSLHFKRFRTFSLHGKLLLSRPFSLLTILGLGAYGNSSDEDSDGEECERADDHSDWEPENVLKVRSQCLSFPQVFWTLNELCRIPGTNQSKINCIWAESKRDQGEVGWVSRGWTWTFQ